MDFNTKKSGVLRWKCLFSAVLICVGAVGCESGTTAVQQKYDVQFYDVFDTVSAVSVFAENQEKADEYTNAVHERLLALHRQFDPYNTYDEPNLKTLNDMAGKEPVTLPHDLYWVLYQGSKIYELTDGKINIAMGATLELWHKYRDDALDNGNIALPSPEELEATRQFNDITALEFPEGGSRVFINREGVSVNLGAVAKGYAAEKAIETLKTMGCDSALINLGGNVACYRGSAKDSPWKVGIQDPQNPEGMIDVVQADNAHLVSSGDYQRYYEYEGKKIHHIIDPETLMPAENYSGTTVIVEGGTDDGTLEENDGMLADMLSTAIFIAPDEDGRSLAAKFPTVKQVYRISQSGALETLY